MLKTQLCDSHKQAKEGEVQRKGVNSTLEALKFLRTTQSYYLKYTQPIDLINLNTIGWIVFPCAKQHKLLNDLAKWGETWNPDFFPRVYSITLLFLHQGFLFCFNIYLFGCTRFQLQHTGSLVVACKLLVEVCGIQFPDQGLNPATLHWKHSLPLDHWEVP